MKRYVTLAALAALAACDAPGGLEAPPAPSNQRVGWPDIIVHAGSSIQAAVDAAGPGTVIQIEPGTYADSHFGPPSRARRPTGAGWRWRSDRESGRTGQWHRRGPRQRRVRAAQRHGPRVR